MATINNPFSLPYPNPRCFHTKPLCTTLPSFTGLFSTTTKTSILKCSNNDSSPENRNLKDALSGMVDKQVEELLSKEENRVLLDGLEKASQRVERAKVELAAIERQQLEAEQLRLHINQLESRASEIAECQQEILEARAKVEEAERFLSNGNDAGEEEIKKDEERLESVKAALISALIGSLAGLPLSLTELTSFPHLILASATTFISCALFGVTFRYAVRRDLDNFQLKMGTCAAFAFVKGLAHLEMNPSSLLAHAADSTVYVCENLLIFGFAAVSLDLCFKMRLLSPFPIKRSE